MGATTQNPGPGLRALSDAAAQMETVLCEAASVLDAITGGGLLDAAPADERDASLHGAATVLLDMLRARVRQIEELPGTDLSITLSIMATEARS